MLDYLEYLEEKLGDNLHKQIQEDALLSMLVYEKESDEISAYELISGYLALCKSVQESYKNFIENTGSNVFNHREAVLLKSITISDVVKEDDKYKFTISAVKPVPFSINLLIEENTYNNEKDDSCVLENDDYSGYELSFDPSLKNKCREVIIAGIFSRYADLCDLYDLLENLYLVHEKLIYGVHAENQLAVHIELSNFGEVNVRNLAGNNFEDIMHVNLKNNGLNFNSSSSTRHSNDFLTNFDYYDSSKNDPLWVLKNMYVKREDIKQKALLAEIDNCSDILDTLFKKAGYGNTLSYKEEYCERHDLYYVYGENNELEEINGYVSVKFDDKHYKFIFEDGSIVFYPIDKIVKVEEDINDERENESEAVKSLNLKTY